MFTGFSPEAIDFLWGIRLNNNREWFQAHKQQYQQSLYEPMKALSQELSAAFAQTEGLKMHLSRIYRDMRMHPPVPYKESLWMCLRRDGGSWLEHPCLFFELTAEGFLARAVCHELDHLDGTVYVDKMIEDVTDQYNQEYHQEEN